MPSSSRRRHLRCLRREDWRDWAALPLDVMCDIFSQLPQAEILRDAGAGLVCASWRRVAVDEPLLWRHIDLASHEGYIGDQVSEGKKALAGWAAMARVAVDRSEGQCVSFRDRVDGDFLHYLADR
ncbi:hypothetical protein D1007_07102 [Hordeum vulgare]|nr:hypothetical protein D1007_07102 [Hordeum vulgare]